MFMESIGWLGNFCLAIVGLPLAFKCLRNGTTSPTLDGMASFLVLWVVGEVAVFAYVVSIGDYPLLLNYSCNLAALTVVIKYWFWPTNKKLDWIPKL